MISDYNNRDSLFLKIKIKKLTKTLSNRKCSCYINFLCYMYIVFKQEQTQTISSTLAEESNRGKFRDSNSKTNRNQPYIKNTYCLDGFPLLLTYLVRKCKWPAQGLKKNEVACVLALHQPSKELMEC